MSSNKSIARSAGIIGGATLLSRILGFVRDIVLAAFFGTGIYAQSFVVAFRIPNLLRDLIGEGATNAAVVPVLVEELSGKGRREFWKLANILLNLILVVLAAITLIGFIAARPIVIAIAPGFMADPDKLNVTVAMTRAIFPYLILIGLAAYGMGVLNSIKHFTAPAFSASMLNISLIVCMFIWRQDIMGLTAGILLGGFLQVMIQVPPLLRNGFILDQKAFTHPKVKKIGRLLLPRIFGTGVYQINVFVSTVLASISGIVGEGAVAALYFSNRILQFPLAIFAIALAQAALPTLSGHVAANDMDKFRRSINFQLRAISFILLPASAGLIALSVPITRVLLERGVFGAYSTSITVTFFMPASSPGRRSTFSSVYPLAAAHLLYMRSSMLAQSHDSVPPAPALILNMALLISCSPLKRLLNSRSSTFLVSRTSSFSTSDIESPSLSSRMETSSSVS
jgi:putative peptidoglycan lipid II flippase